MPIEKIKYRQVYKESIDRFKLSNNEIIYLLLKAVLANQLPLRHLAKGSTKKLLTRLTRTGNARLETMRKKTIHATN